MIAVELGKHGGWQIFEGRRFKALRHHLSPNVQLVKQTANLLTDAL